MTTDATQQTNHSAPQLDEAALRDQMLDHLLDVSTYLVSVTHATELLAGLAQRVVDAVPSLEAGLLWVFERQPGTIRVASVFGLDLGDQQDALLKLRLRPGEGLAGTVIKRNEPLFFEGRVRYREMSINVSQHNQPVLRSLYDLLPRDLAAALLPLHIGSETVGVLELFNFGARPPLHRQDVPMLQLFANLAATAVKSAQLQAHQVRLGAIDAISTAITSAASLPEMMRDVLDVLLGEDVVNTPAGALLLYDPGRSTLTIGAQRGLSDAYVERYLEMSVVGSAAEEAVRYCQPIRRPLIPEGQEEDLIDAGLGSCVYLPLLAGGTVVGVVCVYGDTSFYERVDVKALITMGSLIGFAIANVTLYEASDIERRRLSAVVNGIAEGVVLCDRQGSLVLVNETARALLSLDNIPYAQPLSEMPDFYGFRDMDDAPLPVERLPMARALSGEVFHDYLVLQQGASGRNTVMSFSGAPVYRDDRTVSGAVVVLRDVTAQQKIERAKDDFLAVAAHELRSPLAAVRSYTDLLVRREQRKGTEEDSSDLRGLTVLAQQVSHMLSMVDNLLDLSRMDADQFSLHIQPFDIVALAEQVLAQQRPAAGERALVLESDDAECIVNGDQLRIRQVLTNLVGNAIRYSPSGTEVTVRLASQNASDLAARYSDFAAQLPDYSGNTPMMLVAVSDRGSGVSTEQRGRLFKRYERGRERRGEGLGLGLYLSREFVARHGGAIWVESQPNDGSTFYVALPLGLPLDEETPF